MPFAATWMQLEIITVSEVSQKEKDTYHITYIRNLRYDTNEHIYETKTYRHRLTENRFVVAKGKGVGEERTERFGISRFNLLYMDG